MTAKKNIRKIRKKFGGWSQKEIQEVEDMFPGEERGKPHNTNTGGTKSNFCKDLNLGSALLRSGGCGEPTTSR